MPMYILHDLYIEDGELSVQIDYLVITRKICFVIECKNLYGDIEINNSGDFVFGLYLVPVTTQFLPEYIVAGYSLNRVQEFGENKIIFYQNNQGEEIQFSQSPNNNNYQIDTENAQTTEIIINDSKGILIDKTDCSLCFGITRITLFI